MRNSEVFFNHWAFAALMPMKLSATSRFDFLMGTGGKAGSSSSLRY